MDLGFEIFDSNLFSEIDEILREKGILNNRNEKVQIKSANNINVAEREIVKDYNTTESLGTVDLENLLKNEISKIPQISYEKELYLLNLIKNENNEKAKNELIQLNLKFLQFYIRKFYYKYENEFLDLLQEGAIGLLLALEKYDIHVGSKFITYAGWWVRQIIDRYCHSFLKPIRFPEHINAKLNFINKEKNKYFINNSRYPSLEELAKITCFDIKLLQELEYYNYYIFYSLDLKITALDYEVLKQLGFEYYLVENDKEVELLKDIIKFEFEEDIINKIDNEKLDGVINELLTELEDKEKYIIIMRYGLFNNEAKTLQELADELGYTRERIRQIELNALRALKNSWLLSKLKHFLYE